MTGKEAIIHYLGTHKNFCAQDVAVVTGATVTSINQAAAKMARAGILVVANPIQFFIKAICFAHDSQKDQKLVLC